MIGIYISKTIMALTLLFIIQIQSIQLLKNPEHPYTKKLLFTLQIEKKGYTTEEILNLIDLSQKEVKVSKKSIPTEEKINDENIIPDRNQEICPKEQTKGKHILNKDEINELINIIEECPNTENYRKKR